METPINETPKKSQTPLIIAAVAIVLCCWCVTLVVAGYFGFLTIRNTDTEIQPFEDATPEIQVPSTDLDPENDSAVPGTAVGIGEAPIGGLGNDVLRNDTWQYVVLEAQGQGCDQPVGADTQIEAQQEPHNDVWLETWPVACASGESYPYEVEFILDDTGATFNIKSIP